MLFKIFKNTPAIIAEIGVNHNGQASIARKLVKIASDCGADAVKLQTFKAFECAGAYSETASYQKGECQNQLDLLKSLELSFPDTADLKEYAESLGLTFLSTPDGLMSLDFLCDIGTKIIKVASGELTNIPFLYAIGNKKRPVILSTGMGTLEEIEKAVAALKDSGAPEILLLHCTTAYPTPSDEANLRAINTIKNTFNLQTGFSDHTLGNEASVAALALGAIVFEKHITLDKNLAGPDHNASLDPEEFKNYVDAIRKTAIMLGDGIKKPTRSELLNIPYVRRSIVASKDLKAGEIISGKSVEIKRPATGIQPSDLQNVFGKKLKVDIAQDEPITWEKLE